MGEDTLFDDIKRSDLRSRFNAEPHFAYLNVSARLSASRVRNLADSWYQNMPDGAKKDLRGRFRSSDDIPHFGAFTELYCAALLQRLGFEVEVQPFPSLRGTRIDFLAREGDRPAFLLECVTSGDKDKTIWENGLIRRFYDSINSLQHPDLFVMAEFKRAGTGSPSGRRARGFLQPLLATVDCHLLWTVQTSEDETSIPTWVWQDEGWEIHFRPFPRAPELRGIADMNMVSIQMDRVRSGQPGEDWLRPLHRKTSRYGKLDLPYVIVINGTGMFHRKRNIPDALFGQHAVTIDLKTGKGTPTRHPNGLWVGPTRPRYRRVSAVLFLTHLTPWSVVGCKPELWHNPWADKPLDAAWLLVDQYVHDATAQKMTKIEAGTAASLFGLDPAWPGDD